MLLEELKKIFGDNIPLDNEELQNFIRYCEEINERVVEKMNEIESSDDEKDKICKDLVDLVDGGKGDDKENS